MKKEVNLCDDCFKIGKNIIATEKCYFCDKEICISHLDKINFIINHDRFIPEISIMNARTCIACSDKIKLLDKEIFKEVNIRYLLFLKSKIIGEIKEKKIKTLDDIENKYKEK